MAAVSENCKFEIPQAEARNVIRKDENALATFAARAKIGDSERLYQEEIPPT